MGYACRVNQYIYPTGSLRNFREGIFYLKLIADIHSECRGLSTVGLYRVNGFVRSGLVQFENEDRGALFCKKFGHSAPDSTSSTGNDRSFVLKTKHDLSFSIQ